MDFYVYILYSASADKYYVGSTSHLKQRLKIHNAGGYKHSSTKFATDWDVFYTLKCETRAQAGKIEQHIKRMRNRTYYQNLKKYPKMGKKLLLKYL